MSSARFVNHNQSNTQVIDAIRHYREKDFERATAVLYELLDKDPNNIEARLLLASCLLFAAHYFLAGQAFLHVVQHAKDPDLRLQGRRGVESVKRHVQNISHFDDSFAESAVHLLCKKAISNSFYS